ncbi:hypothetical protein [Methanocella sp. MCL-LM]|uniref:hypothetical protein n=1 Tax=Methanocella sp. MCL-LM TaxID=3412035 RepID=UPI003C7258C7
MSLLDSLFGKKQAKVTEKPLKISTSSSTNKNKALSSNNIHIPSWARDKKFFYNGRDTTADLSDKLSITYAFRTHECDVDEPDFAGFEMLLERFDDDDKAVAWREIGIGFSSRLKSLKAIQCFIKSLEHYNDPDFLGWYSICNYAVKQSTAPMAENVNTKRSNLPNLEAFSDRLKYPADPSKDVRLKLIQDLKKACGAPGESLQN